jgi:IS5 family transposase
MQLVGYFNGIAKDRRLCEEVRYNLAYRWFCRLLLDDDVPDHSSLTRIRDRLGEEVFEAVFRQIVSQCQQKGLVKDPCRVMTDATLIAADASLKRHDNQPYLAQFQRVKDQYKVTIYEATADRGYGSAAIIRTLQEREVTPYIPLWSGRVGNGKYLKSEFARVHRTSVW